MVDIDNLEFSTTELYVRWDRLQVTNPKQTMKNKLETGKCEFDIELLPLLSKKFIIESFSITDVQTNTDREEDGRIEKESGDRERSFIMSTIDYLEEEVASNASPQFSALTQKTNVDSILKILDIQSIQKITNLQNEMNVSYSDWEKKLTGLNMTSELKQVESQIHSIDVKKLKTADEILGALKKVDNINSTIKSNSNSLAETKNNLLGDLSDLKTKSGQVDDWVKNDYAQAFSLAKIPEINAENIGKLLFGKNVVDQFNSYLSYVATAREYSGDIDSDKPEKKSPSRLKGQDIYFYSQHARPDFWIRHANLSGQTESKIAWSGIINNIVSDQRLINSPTEIAVKGKSGSGATLSLNGLLNYLEDKPEESFNIDYSGFSLANFKLSDSNLLPNEIKKGVGSVNTRLNISGEKINGRISFVGNKLQFGKSVQNEKQNKFEEIMQSILKNTSTIDFLAKIEGEADNLHFSVNSNIDDILSNKIGAIVGEEVNKAKQEIKNKIDNEIGQHKAALDNLVTEKENLLKTEINKYEKLIDDQLNQVEAKKKEIEKKYAKEKSGIEKKIKDIIKF
jgi:uncharacterized protein (TIGR03545 family)